MACLLTLLALSSAMAQQTRFDSEAGATSTKFDYEWIDHLGIAHEVTFELDNSDIERDLAIPLDIEWAKMDAFVSKELYAWADTQPDIALELKTNDTGRMCLTSIAEKSRLSSAFDEAWDQMHQAEDLWAQNNGYIREDGNFFLEDHAKLSAEYAPRLVAVATALASEGDTPRDFALRALGFLQNIPYDARSLGRDIGYRRPFAALAQNRADCDSKSVVMLALMRAAYPDLGVAVVNIPGHTFVALELEPGQSDITVDWQGKSWVTADPVGPFVDDLGSLSKRTTRMIKRGRHDVRAVQPTR